MQPVQVRKWNRKNFHMIFCSLVDRKIQIFQGDLLVSNPKKKNLLNVVSVPLASDALPYSITLISSLKLRATEKSVIQNHLWICAKDSDIQMWRSAPKKVYNIWWMEFISINYSFESFWPVDFIIRPLNLVAMALIKLTMWMNLKT